MDAIALLKREEEQATLGAPPAGGKLTYYRKMRLFSRQDFSI